MVDHEEEHTGQRKDSDHGRPPATRMDIVYGTSGAAVMSVFKHGFIDAITTEGGVKFAGDPVAQDVVADFGRPSIAMAAFDEAEPSLEYLASEDGEGEFGDMLAYGIVRGDVLTHMALALATGLYRYGFDWELHLPEDSDAFMDGMALINAPRKQLVELRTEWLGETTHFLRENWAAVERVAKSVLERGTLEYDTIAELTGFDPEITYRHQFHPRNA